MSSETREPGNAGRAGKAGRARDTTVLAAGGVVVSADGERVLLVHRPRYGDWSLPKGKLDPGETAAQAALREVHEEAGYRCELGRELNEVRYIDRYGRPKRVRYWTMTVESGSFTPNDEVDSIRWVTEHEARELVTYAGDIDLITSALGDPRR